MFQFLIFSFVPMWVVPMLSSELTMELDKVAARVITMGFLISLMPVTTSLSVGASSQTTGRVPSSAILTTMLLKTLANSM